VRLGELGRRAVRVARDRDDVRLDVVCGNGGGEPASAISPRLGSRAAARGAARADEGEEGRRRTDHALLLADDLAEVFEDLVQLGDALLDLLDLALALLDELLLEVEVGVGELVLRLAAGGRGRQARASVRDEKEGGRGAGRTARAAGPTRRRRSCARGKVVSARPPAPTRLGGAAHGSGTASAASTVARCRSTKRRWRSALRRDTTWNCSSARWKSAETFCCSWRWWRCERVRAASARCR